MVRAKPLSLRWGVLSTARIGRNAVNPAIAASNNGTLDAIASRDGERARMYAHAAGIPRHFGSYEALLDDPNIDAIYNPLPNSLHAQWTARALERGKHVLCEKPLGVSAAECLEMKHVAAANGVKLMEAFMYRFHPRTEHVLELVRSGSIGDVHEIRSAFTFRSQRIDDVRFDPALGGGALYDVGCYCVSISRSVAGAEPVEVQASATMTPTGVDGRLAGDMRFASGLVARFECALDADRRECYEIVGTAASLGVDAAFTARADAVEIVERRADREAVRHRFPRVDQYRLMLEHFGDCVLHKRPVRYDAGEAAANLVVIEALLRSARSRGKAECV